MGGPERPSTPELVARALEIKPLPQRNERREMQLPEGAEQSIEFWKSRKNDILSNEGFMGDPSIPPLPKFAQERIERMVSRDAL
ncbi:hypothetical protein PFISCL1PPCAC_24801, partial [Pristionchus fissidentatus]